MKSAYSDFLAALVSLREEAAQLPNPTLDKLSNNRSAAHLRLNGLSVVAFAVLEDFVRRRAFEIIRWLGEQKVPFSALPAALQSTILIGTLKGLNFSLDKEEKVDRALIVQLEGMLLGQTGENGKFVPSEYFFGRSSSNVSERVIKELLHAIGFKEVQAAFSSVGRKFRLSDANKIFDIFGGLAKKRHLAAHTFPLDYLQTDFSEDVYRRMPVFAACFDVCLSQYAFLHATDVLAQRNIVFKQDEFLEARSKIRVVEWNSQEKRWDEYLDGRLARHYRGKAIIEKRKYEFKAGKFGHGHSVLWLDQKNVVVEWHNPIP